MSAIAPPPAGCCWLLNLTHLKFLLVIGRTACLGVLMTLDMFPINLGGLNFLQFLVHLPSLYSASEF
jgi:hypothetical protein